MRVALRLVNNRIPSKLAAATMVDTSNVFFTTVAPSIGIAGVCVQTLTLCDCCCHTSIHASRHAALPRPHEQGHHRRQNWPAAGPQPPPLPIHRRKLRRLGPRLCCCHLGPLHLLRQRAWPVHRRFLHAWHVPTGHLSDAPRHHVRDGPGHCSAIVGRVFRLVARTRRRWASRTVVRGELVAMASRVGNRSNTLHCMA